ncbi:hypothetical protein [Planctomicrobium piriforme]|uniref:Uncharacterized protein n=1 Tax=Planctomicrobium piriforme TaxID=1576369 RepID=A0A1I3M501_9PLAN|nr:hypothetical protein [Planctomicrobium piriforme]SFI92038.1 hypothetical protein SAMN05421753_113159 [Planctomicrobium piriforme]
MPVVVARGELREQIEATPMEDRPYRPFHFYGNTVRRVHYHGSALPRVFVRPVLDTNSSARVNVVENARERRSTR